MMSLSDGGTAASCENGAETVSLGKIDEIGRRCAVATNANIEPTRAMVTEGSRERLRLLFLFSPLLPHRNEKTRDRR